MWWFTAINFVKGLFSGKSSNGSKCNSFKVGAILGGILALVLYFGYGHVQDLNETITLQESEISSKAAQITSLQTSVDKQNASIDKYKEESAARQAKVDAAKEEIAKLNQELVKKTNAISSEEVSKTCEGSMNWLYDKAANGEL